RCDRKRRSNGALAGTAFLGDKRNRPHIFPSQHTSCAQAAAGVEGSSQGTLSNCGRCVNKALAKRRFPKTVANLISRRIPPSLAGRSEGNRVNRHREESALWASRPRQA